MAKGANQKLKMIRLLELLWHESDELHPLSMGEILRRLEAQGISAERKSVYDDIEVLRNAGIADILRSGGKNGGYYLAQRSFQLPELKLLVDAVQASKFVTTKKSRQLIKKLEAQASVHEAKQLQRQVYTANRVKAVNEQIYYNIDKLYEAIQHQVRITFTYLEWQLDLYGEKQAVKRPRRGGALYEVSPWALTWDDENYYLVAFDADAGIAKHYRVDKMQGISLTQEPRQGQALFSSFDMALYSQKTFSMFGGAEQPVRIRFAAHLIGVVADRFGDDLFLRDEGDGSFSVELPVAVSPPFFSWVAGFGANAKILSPTAVAEEFAGFLHSALSLY